MVSHSSVARACVSSKAQPRTTAVDKKLVSGPFPVVAVAYISGKVALAQTGHSMDSKKTGRQWAGLVVGDGVVW